MGVGICVGVGVCVWVVGGWGGVCVFNNQPPCLPLCIYTMPLDQLFPSTYSSPLHPPTGHAIVALNTKGATPIHKATIMPRGHSLGYVSMVPEADKHDITKMELLAGIDVCMGGRVAEELIFGEDHVTTGAVNDLQQVGGCGCG